MDKVLEFIKDNKKIVIIVVGVMFVLPIISMVLLFALNSGSRTEKAEAEQTEQVEEISKEEQRRRSYCEYYVEMRQKQQFYSPQDDGKNCSARGFTYEKESATPAPTYTPSTDYEEEETTPSTDTTKLKNGLTASETEAKFEAVATGKDKGTWRTWYNKWVVSEPERECESIYECKLVQAVRNK